MCYTALSIPTLLILYKRDQLISHPSAMVRIDDTDAGEDWARAVANAQQDTPVNSGTWSDTR